MVRIGGFRAVMASVIMSTCVWSFVGAEDSSPALLGARPIAPPARVPTDDAAASEALSHVPDRLWPVRSPIGMNEPIHLEGTCPVIDGEPLGPVEIWIDQVTEPIHTGITATHWSYVLSVTDLVSTLHLTVWCGTPAPNESYPPELVITVDMVATGRPPTPPPIAPTVPPEVAQDPPVVLTTNEPIDIPATE